ncbi:MAG: hypothetical protein KAJ51_07105 [Thermoplasmata archaeon]|nr:hypothetical protein [Thermoplasmata archaeon]
MELKDDATIGEVLLAARQADKVVTVDMSNGKAYRGKVLQVGTYEVRLELQGEKSFYDAMVRLEHISAVEIQVRE